MGVFDRDSSAEVATVVRLSYTSHPTIGDSSWADTKVIIEGIIAEARVIQAWVKTAWGAEKDSERNSFLRRD
jgi:hypothetical protein